MSDAEDLEWRAAEHLAMLRTLWEGQPVVVHPDVAVRLAAGLRSGALTPELAAFRIALGILEEETYTCRLTRNQSGRRRPTMCDLNVGNWWKVTGIPQGCSRRMIVQAKPSDHPKAVVFRTVCAPLGEYFTPQAPVCCMCFARPVLGFCACTHSPEEIAGRARRLRDPHRPDSGEPPSPTEAARMDTERAAMRASADERIARRERHRQEEERFAEWWNEVIRRGEKIRRQFEEAAFGAVVGAGNPSPQAKVYGQRRAAYGKEVYATGTTADETPPSKAAELRRAAADKKGMQEQFREWFEGGRGARARGRGGAGRRSGGRR